MSYVSRGGHQSRASAANRRSAAPVRAVQLLRLRSQTGAWRSITSTPAPRRHEMTWTLRG
jgi:hypothetical protein